MWYYVDGMQQRQGPLEAMQLVERWEQGLVRADSLVWREGMADWRPLQEVASELPLRGDWAMPPVAPAHMAVIEPASPYAPPAAVVAAPSAVPLATDVVLARFWKRLAAMIIDGLVMGAAIGLLVVLGLLLFGGLAAGSSGLSDAAKGLLGLGFVLGVYVVPLCIQLAYFSWMQASSLQASLGKLAVGIKVVRSDGQPLTLGRSFGRTAANILLGFFSCGITNLVSAFMVGLGLRKQSIHDVIADTLVVDKWAFTAHPERQRRDLGTVTWVMLGLGILLVVGYFVLIIAAAVLGNTSH